jgi:hypothetical protein
MPILSLHCSLIGYAFRMQEWFNHARRLTAYHMHMLLLLAFCLVIAISIQNLSWTLKMVTESASRMLATQFTVRHRMQDQ